MQSRNQYLKVLRERYLKAKAKTKKENSLILDEYCGNTGQARSQTRLGEEIFDCPAEGMGLKGSLFQHSLIFYALPKKRLWSFGIGMP